MLTYKGNWLFDRSDHLRRFDCSRKYTSVQNGPYDSYIKHSCCQKKIIQNITYSHINLYEVIFNSVVMILTRNALYSETFKLSSN